MNCQVNFNNVVFRRIGKKRQFTLGVFQRLLQMISD